MSRRKRAEEERMVLTLLEGNDVAIQSEKSDNAHLVITAGSDAKKCYCPDKQNRHPEKCKHEIAWEEWLIDEVRFSDGEVAWVRDGDESDDEIGSEADSTEVSA